MPSFWLFFGGHNAKVVFPAHLETLDINSSIDFQDWDWWQVLFPPLAFKFLLILWIKLMAHNATFLSPRDLLLITRVIQVNYSKEAVL